MEIYQFEICSIGMELRAEKPIRPDAEMLRFAKPLHEPELTVLCRPVEQLPEPGTPLGQTPDSKVYRIENRIQRIAWGGKWPYAVLTYDPRDLRHVTLEIPQSDWDWVTRGLRLWIAACFPVLLLRFQSMLIHASFIEYRGEGILFTAPSQTGKSTQAELWRRYRGAEVINGDKAGISLRGQAAVHSVPFSGTSGICKNRSLPLKAIVVLSQAPENTLRCLPAGQAVAAVCQNIFADHAVPEEWSGTMDLLLELVSRVPVYALACTPDERAVCTLEQTLYPKEGEK